jgi:hypothetical protein
MHVNNEKKKSNLRCFSMLTKASWSGNLRAKVMAAGKTGTANEED